MDIELLTPIFLGATAGFIGTRETTQPTRMTELMKRQIQLILLVNGIIGRLQRTQLQEI